MNLPHLVPPDYQTAWRPGQTSEEYHADKTAQGSTTLKHFRKSPAKYFYEHQRIEEEKTEALRLGNLIHLALLEPDLFNKKYVVLPEFTGKTKKGEYSTRCEEARQMKADWLNSLPAGTVVIQSQDEFDRIQRITESVLKHPDSKRLFQYGFAERSGYFRDPETGILCKFKPDFFNESIMALIDFKTTRDCSIDAFERAIEEYQYGLSLAQYCLGIELITGKQVEFPTFICVEKEPPYECAIYIADDEVMKKGRCDFRLYMNQLKDCLTKNAWPGGQALSQMISRPKWAIKKEEAIYE